MGRLAIQQKFDLALRRHRAGQLQEAEQLYREILAQEPEHADATHNLGVMAQQAGQHDNAVSLLRRAIVLRPNYAEAHYNLGIVLKGQGRIEEAIAAYRQAIALKPNLAQAHGNLGIALGEQGRLDEAIAALRQAIALAPNYAEAHNHLGIALAGQGQLDGAIAAFCEAIVLRPAYAEAHNNLGNVLRSRGRLDEAVAAHRQAIVLRPSYAEAHSNLGNALKGKGRVEEAVAAYRQAIVLRPDYAEAYSNLGIALKEMRQLDESIAAHRQAVALRPNLPEAFNNLGLALADIGQVEEAIAAYRHAIALRPNYVDAHNNLLLTLHYHPAYEAGAIAEEHRRWNPQHAEPLRKFIHIHSNDRDPDRPLRVGYVSADFRWHSVSCFFENLLAFHDRQWVQTYCYCDVTRPDATTVRLQQQAANWRNIAGMRDEAVGELVRQDQIDILVDLSGHTGSNRLLVFARKPAPIQITYLGYPDTTGMPAMDYRLTDEYADPPGQTESLHSEQLVRLPRTFLCYRAPDAAPAVGPSPVSRDGHVIFGSFNALAKVNAPLVRLWSRILREVPDSRIVLKSYGLTSSSAQQWVLNLFAAEGIGADRVEVHGWQPDEGAHFQLYGRLDIALDTFPYHGTTTTCEAMWMGVPTITLAGRVHVSRVGVSLLNNVGLPGLVAHSQEEYVRIASELGNNHSHLSELRSTLRQRMEQSPLMDATKFARDVEAAYRRIWHTWAAASAKR